MGQGGHEDGLRGGVREWEANDHTGTQDGCAILSGAWTAKSTPMLFGGFCIMRDRSSSKKAIQPSTVLRHFPRLMVKG